MDRRPLTAQVEDRLTAFAALMTADMLMTPRQALVCIDEHESLARARELMSRGLDQLPVTRDGAVSALLVREDVESARRAHGDAAPVASLARAIDGFERVPADEPLAAVIDRLALHERLIIAAPAADSAAPSPDADPVAGLIHFSDLNRHAVRIFFYLWISAVEIGLAEFIRALCPREDDWIPHLTEQRQVTVLGRREFERRRNVDLHAVEGTDLTDLIRVCLSAPGAIEALGMPSRSAFDKRTGGLVDLRHDVMHPVRAMVREHADVEQMRQRLTNLRELVDAARRAAGGPHAAPVAPPSVALRPALSGTRPTPPA